MQQFHHPQPSVTTGAYSAGLRCGDWLYVSGQGPLDMKTGDKVGGDIREQTHQTLSNVETVLKQAGLSRKDVVKCTCYLSEIANFKPFNEAYAEFFADEPRPARTTVAAGLPGIMVEIDAIAYMPQ